MAIVKEKKPDKIQRLDSNEPTRLFLHITVFDYIPEKKKVHITRNINNEQIRLGNLRNVLYVLIKRQIY